ncbi:Hypothetical protein A7982_07612 [Minicystis rosea]|nr:Hypothetical protein A7982_07612 [Minicystis rosea]
MRGDSLVVEATIMHRALTFLLCGAVAGCAGSVVTIDPVTTSSTIAPDSTGGSGGAETTATTGAGASGGAGGGWHGGPVTVLGEAILDALASVDGDAMVGLRRFDSNTVLWDVQRLSADGSPAAPPINQFHSGFFGSIGAIEIASHGADLGAMAWEEKMGCRFVPLTADGKPIEPSVTVKATWCEGLAGDDGGFTFLGGPMGFDPPTLFRVGNLGVPAASKVLSNVVAYQGRANQPGGTMLLAWSTDPVECYDCPLHVVAQPFAADGVSLASAFPLFEDPAFGLSSDRARVALIPVTGGALLAWSPANGANAMAGAITVLPLDLTGTPVSAPLVVAPFAGAPIGGLGLANAPNGDVVLAWTTTHQGGTLRARVLSPKGEPLVEAFDVAAVPNATVVRVTGTSTGALAVVQTGATVSSVAILQP